MIASVALSVLIWLLKSMTYWGVFRWRVITASALDCLIIAGCPFLLMVVPLPPVVYVLTAISLAIFFTMRYTGVRFIPYGLFIPLGIECTYLIGLECLRAFGIWTYGL